MRDIRSLIVVHLSADEQNKLHSLCRHPGIAPLHRLLNCVVEDAVSLLASSDTLPADTIATLRTRMGLARELIKVLIDQAEVVSSTRVRDHLAGSPDVPGDMLM